MLILAWTLAGLVCAPLVVFAAECFAGLHDDAPAEDLVVVPPFAVLMPAHDEAAGIAATIEATRRQLRPRDRLLVVADNCSDATAAVALRAGAAVCRRDEPDHPGKGYALAFGREALRGEPPALVILLDADCVPEPGALPRLAASALRRQAAVQGCYLLAIDERATPVVRISTFAFLIKNRIRQRGLQRLSGLALLQGTGMAMPWRVFDAAPLATPSLVEDMQLGLDLVLAGESVRFEDSARFVSRASSEAATRSQRTRWEHGSMGVAAAYVPRLLRAAFARPRLLPLAADLAVPPLALLVAAAAAATLALAAVGGGPILLLLAAETLFTVALALAWVRHGRAMLPAATLLRLPRYILWKQPIYRRLVTDRERRWVRTSRAP